MQISNESLNALSAQCLKAVTDVDLAALRTLCHQDVAIQVPGARDVDLTIHTDGVEGLCEWATNVHEFCGQTSFAIHRYFENGCELMASGTIHIQRLPRVFSSPCSLLFRYESGQVIFLQLLLDSFALEKFRGQMD